MDLTDLTDPGRGPALKGPPAPAAQGHKGCIRRSALDGRVTNSDCYYKKEIIYIDTQAVRKWKKRQNFFF